MAEPGAEPPCRRTREHGGNATWLFRVVERLRREDTRWGVNWKRANVGDMSEDVITYNFGTEADEGTLNVHVVDIIGGHCGPNPVVSGLGDVTMSTWNAGLANTPGCSTRFCAAWTLSGYPFQP